METQNRMGAKMQPSLTPEVLGEFLSDPDILMKGSDQLEYDVRHAFAATCFPEGSAIEGVESRLNVHELNVHWSVKFTM